MPNLLFDYTKICAVCKMQIKSLQSRVMWSPPPAFLL